MSRRQPLDPSELYFYMFLAILAVMGVLGVLVLIHMVGQAI